MELQKSSEWKASVLDNFMDYFRRVIRISAQGRFKHFRAVQFKPSKYSEGLQQSSASYDLQGEASSEGD